ncbi:hypothetical protein GGS21DRAFT_490909 [Xylaria nigripes]|nr:hypothetical protein GGS21DRAFT_490909 [Xylaria nigripes]
MDSDFDVAQYVAIALVLLLIIIVPRAIMSFYGRIKPTVEMPYRIRQAMKRLYTVAEKLSVDDFTVQDNISCSICLEHIHGFTPRQETSQNDDLEAGLGGQPAPMQRKQHLLARFTRPEILRLNECGHVFHSKCLCTWFMMGNRSCPLCRRIFITLRELRRFR